MARANDPCAVGRTASAPPLARWRDLLAGAHVLFIVVLASGIALHAINLYITTSILPSVVADIGGISLYAWTTTVFVVASIIGAAIALQVLQSVGPRVSYLFACVGFAAGTGVCAAASTMQWMLLGRAFQGLGGGLLLALPYVLARRVLPAPLWPRVMALFSGMWGVATLLGPAVGGVLAQYLSWRLAFWSLVPVALLLALGAIFTLRWVKPDTCATAPPTYQLILLSLAVLVASCSTLTDSAFTGSLCLIGAAGLLVAVGRHDRVASSRLLPRATYTRGSLLGSLYLVSVLMAITVTCTELFIPLFLQRIQGHSPLSAGYIAATASAGWTLGALCSASLAPRLADRLARAAPWPCVMALILLCVTMPQPSASPLIGMTLIIVLGLTVLGFGVGLAWPQLANQVMTTAPSEEADLAASAIMTVQLIGTTMSAAAGGYLIQMTADISAGHFAVSAAWLFGILAFAPALAATLWLRQQSEPK